MAIERTRREIIGWALSGAVGAAALQSAAAAAEPACFNPEALPASQKNMRNSLNFRIASSDPKKKCGSCAFFTPQGSAGCGVCTLLSGGPVLSGSVCDSWAPRG